MSRLLNPQRWYRDNKRDLKLLGNGMYLGVMLLLLLGSCTNLFQPGTGGPEVVAPLPNPEQEVERTLYITQRALPDAPYNDIFVTMLATDVRTNERVEFGLDSTSPAFLSGSDERCILSGSPSALVCELGNLEPGEVAEPVAVTLAPYVRLSCAASGFLGGSVSGYRPQPCVSSSNPPL